MSTDNNGSNVKMVPAICTQCGGTVEVDKDKETATCPFCGGRIIPIIYGEPSDETFEKAEKGEVKLGGCCLSGADPQWACAECGQEFLQK